RDRDPSGSMDGDPERHPGGRRRGRRGLLPNPLPDHLADASPDRERRAPLRSHLHVHRHDRRLHPHAGRTLRHDAGAPLPRLLHRHPGQRPGRGGGDLPLPGAAAGRGRLAVAPIRPPRRRGGMMAVRRAGTLARTVKGTILLGFSIALAFPFYWMAITSFKRTTDLYNLKNNPFLFSEPPTLEHLRLLLQETLFLRWFGNTCFAGALVALITLALAMPAAYA